MTPGAFDDELRRAFDSLSDRLRSDLTDQLNVWGYITAQVMTQILKQCGDDLTRENVIKQAANLKSFELPLYLPGIRNNTSASDYRVIKQMYLMRFDGKKWVPFGELQGG